MGGKEQGGQDCVALLPGPREKGDYSGHWRHVAFLKPWLTSTQAPSNSLIQSLKATRASIITV